MYIQRVKRCHKPNFARNSADQKTVFIRDPQYRRIQPNNMMMAKIHRERKNNAESVINHVDSYHAVIMSREISLR